MEKYIFVDAETDGLHGTFLTVAMIAIDVQGQEIDRMYCGIARDKIQVSNKWVKENVLPIMGKYLECQREEELLEHVWAFWMQHKENAYCVADTIYPVECRLFEKCIELDKKNREYEGPFPLLDLCSILYAKGIEPNISRESLIDKSSVAEKHNALHDVEVSIEIWKKYVWGK